MGKDFKAIDDALAKLEKRFGEKCAMKMTDSESGVATFSSGRPDLDAAMGGGFPIGKIIEIIGGEASGKTGLALSAIRMIQEEGGLAAFVDAEHALNKEYAYQIGVNVEDMYISQPSYGEQSFEIIRGFIHSKQFDIIVVDSVSALTPLSELNGEVGEAKMAAQARMMSQGLRLITAAADEVGCTVLFINQQRDKIGYVTGKIGSGGNALKFYASIRLHVKNKGKVIEGEEVIGFKQNVQVIKNKIAAPFKAVENDIIYGKGVDTIISLIAAAVDAGVIIRAGSYYKHEGESIARGMKDLRKIVEDNPELQEVLKNQILKT